MVFSFLNTTQERLFPGPRSKKLAAMVHPSNSASNPFLLGRRKVEDISETPCSLADLTDSKVQTLQAGQTLVAKSAAVERIFGTGQPNSVTIIRQNDDR